MCRGPLLKIWIVFTALLVPIGLGACSGGTQGDSKVVKIVSSLPRTGSANAQTTTVVNGIKMAIEENGHKAGPFEVKYEDWDDASPQKNAWDQAVEAANADRAVQDMDIVAYIGTFNSGAAKISMPKLNQASLLMVSPANTAAGLTKPGMGEPNEPAVYRPSGKVNYFRVIPADDIQGVVAAEWAKELGASSVYVLHDREVYGKGIAEIFRRHAEEIGLKVLGFDGIDTKAANYRALAAKILGDSPDLVYFGGTTQSNGGQVTKDLRTSGFSKAIMVPDGCVEDAFIEAAEAANVNSNTYATFGGLPPDQLSGKGAEFYKNYRAKYGHDPQVYAVYGYEAAKATLKAIEIAGVKDRAAIVEAMKKIGEFDGALGKWKFDDQGDTSLKTMSGQQVVDGKWKFVKELGGTANEKNAKGGAP